MNNLLVNLFFKVTARLPLPIIYYLGAIVGWLVWLLSSRYRQCLHNNLMRAIGKDKFSLKCGAISSAGRQILELPFVWMKPQEIVAAKITEVKGSLHIKEAQEKGQSILFLTPHLGCFELCAQHCSHYGKITVLFRDHRKKVLSDIMLRGREKGNVKTAPANLSGVRSLLKALKSGEMVGMLPDQVPKAGEGIWAPFFGQSAWTMTLAARLSSIKNVCVLMIWVERLKYGKGYVVHIQKTAQALEGNIESRTQMINREIEQLILNCPEQYLWGYNRYKNPAALSVDQES